MIYVVVIKFGLKIKTLLDGNFGKNLTHLQLEPMKPTYEPIIHISKSVDGHIGVKI